MRSDADLLAAWKDGDADAGGALVERHFAMVYRFFRNKIDGDLDDLVQDTFARCVDRADAVADNDRFRAFLLGVARNVLRERYRAKASRPDAVDFDAQSVADLGTSPTGALARKRDHRLLLAALRSIPLEDQVALELVYWESMTGRELAQVMQVPEGTARTRLRSARLSLEAALAKLARTPEQLQSTRDNLVRWSGAIREYLAADA